MSAVVLRGCCLAATEKGQQRTWDHIPKRNCMWETTTTKNCIFVEMRNTCQVTNQSSHGELSFHHNPHLRLCWGLGLSTSRVVRRGGSRLKNAAHPTYCHCCEFCALKQKPGVLLEKKKPAFGFGLNPLIQEWNFFKEQIPTADRTHHRIRSPSIKCSGT